MDRMAKSFKVFLFIFIFLLPEGLSFAQSELARGWEPISLFNDRVRITGTFDHQVKLRTHLLKNSTGGHPAERWARKSNFSMFRSNLSLEAEWWMVKKPTWELNLITHLYYTYDFMGTLDSEFKRAMPPRSYKQYIRNEGEVYIIRELYAQIIRGPWDIRIGKQQVVWGNQIGIQTTDVVNPLDIRTQVIGLTEWENVRMGLWMLRTVYHTTLPGELDLEAIFIPDDFEYFRIPLEGSWLGGISNEPGIGNGPGFLDHLWYRMEHDARKINGLRNAEWGFRVRGYSTTLDLDWTLIFFHTIDDGPVTADPEKFSKWLLTDYAGVPYLERPRMPSGIFDYKPYNIFGGTLQHYSPLLKAIIRMEMAYVDNKHYDKGNEVVERDSIGLGLSIDKDMKVPYLYELQGNQNISISVDLNQLWYRDYNKRVSFSRNHPRGDTYDTSLSWFLMLHFLDDKILPICRGTYYFTNATKFTITIPYKPGEHWSYSVSISQFMNKRKDAPQWSMEQRDAIGFKISYIF